MTSLYPADTVSGVVTSFVPLTTVFTPPSSCSSIFRQGGASYIAFDPGYGLDVNNDIICQPPAVTTWWEQGNLGNAAEGHTAVSLGPLTCPQDWKTMETSVKDEYSTAAICCPSGYYLDGGTERQVTGACLSDVASGYKGIWAYTNDGTKWTVTTSTLTKDSSTVGAIAVVGWNIKQSASSDSSLTSSSQPISSTPITSAAASHASATPSTSSSPTSSASSASGLSTGASVGVGLGVALGLVGIVSLLVVVHLIKRRREKKSATMSMIRDPPELHTVDYKPDGVSPWSAQTLGAMGSGGHRSELSSENASRPVELAG